MKKGINRQKFIVYWLYTGLLMSMLIVVIGGITRLTNSGLSMVEWELIMDMVPPVSESQWNNKFEDYKKFPEYKKYNQEMSISEFKLIFFWEWLHRFIARLIGMVFIFPFIFFWMKNWINKKLKIRFIYLLLLGMLQAFLGAYMVNSGLEIGKVSHFRLATHLSAAFILISYIYWLILEIQNRDTYSILKINTLSKVLLFFISIQIIYGAFVAGLNAGSYFSSKDGVLSNIFFYNTHDDEFDLLKNPNDVQAFHRIFAWVVFTLIIYLWHISKGTKMYKTVSTLLFIIIIQISLGITTLLTKVDMNIALMHQLVAIFILIFTIKTIYLSSKKTQ